MTTDLLKTPDDNLPKLNYSVLIEKKEDGYQATVWGMPEYQVFAATREEALSNLHQLINARLQKVEIVSQEIELSKSEHPWMKFAGMYQNNPLFNEVLASIESYRRELDAEMDVEDEA
ncbi:type II toxin-antitoxin system HicB family antitoxin [Iningainema tapete]|uniref:Type II toxin-antitoxin system HicB family antitoxin n=1 Tax=Iningainema tapete BLCC-T55 TaxID=2748662 RepID=A0A8J7BYL1_9CYAN|nr:type II toxin-antitoxin system HicB family antitoxin [Iningainema tapete]MBD2774228.1 type II toxin-antitoxin system HicB family antitoxin [Iningainema tapete BLCC-T55]